MMLDQKINEELCALYTKAAVDNACIVNSEFANEVVEYYFEDSVECMMDASLNDAPDIVVGDETCKSNLMDDMPDADLSL
jgi:hypothetical protein